MVEQHRARRLRLRARRGDARAADRRRLRWPTGRRSRPAGTRSSSITTWPTAAAIGAGVTRSTPRPSAARSSGRAHQPHYQSRDYNALNGGIARWFEPIDDGDRQRRHDAGDSGGSRAWFESLAGARRLAASKSISSASRRAPAKKAGRRRKACTVTASTTCSCCWSIGRTSPAARRRFIVSSGEELGAFTLTEPLDAALLDDSRVAHGVTPIEPVDPDPPCLPRRAGRDLGADS